MATSGIGTNNSNFAGPERCFQTPKSDLVSRVTKVQQERMEVEDLTQRDQRGFDQNLSNFQIQLNEAHQKTPQTRRVSCGVDVTPERIQSRNLFLNDKMNDSPVTPIRADQAKEHQVQRRLIEELDFVYERLTDFWTFTDRDIPILPRSAGIKVRNYIDLLHKYSAYVEDAGLKKKYRGIVDELEAQMVEPGWAEFFTTSDLDVFQPS